MKNLSTIYRKIENLFQARLAKSSGISIQAILFFEQYKSNTNNTENMRGVNMRVNRKEIINTLLQRDGEYCSICGQPFGVVGMTVDCIVPKSKGGDYSIDNLQLLCPSCNAMKGSQRGVLLGYQFEEYIKQLLDEHPSFDLEPNLAALEGAPQVDIVAKRRKEGRLQLVVCELRTSTSYTFDRIRAIIERLNLIKQYVPDSIAAFVFPGELPENYMVELQRAGIEIWDKKYLVKEFGEQIEQRKNTIFSRLLLSGIQCDQETKKKDKYSEAIEELRNCPSGKENWGKYQKLVGKILELLFCPDLGSPIPQSEDFTRTNRRDYIMANYTSDEIWSYLRNKYCADYLVVDAKNSGKPIQKADLLQIGHYLKWAGAGLFGVIISRKGIGKSASFSQRELWIQDKKMIIVLDDSDVEQMLLERKSDNNPAKVLLKKIEDFRLSI